MYLSERKVLDQFIDNQLLELQAKKAGLTVDQLLEKEAYKGIKDPTEDQMEVYYEGLGMDQPFAAVQGSDSRSHPRSAKDQSPYRLQ